MPTRAFGVAPDTRVGIHLQRSVGMIVAVLGVLKSGAAYVPLDPSYPFDRLAFMLKDAGTPLIVTESELLDALPASDALPICLDDDEEFLAIDQAATTTTPANLAYVIYTSRSTGKPKGDRKSTRLNSSH